MKDWISVEERLPEVSSEYNYSESVLVTVKYPPAPWVEQDQSCQYSVEEAQLTFNGVWVRSMGEDSLIEYSRGIQVIGWMPLPEPMKDATD